MTQFDCELNSVSLSGLDERICVLDIVEEAPKLRTASAFLRTGGQRLLSQARESLSVQIRFAIHEEKPDRRSALLSLVRAWAAPGGFLVISPRPEQQMQVLCAAMPAVSANDWTQELTLTFTSLTTPYWEDIVPTEIVTDSSSILTLPGAADSAPVDVVVTNAGSEAITDLIIYCGPVQMHFTGFSLPANGEFLLVYTRGVLHAKVDGVSVMKYRTADSADLLLAPCGDSVIVGVQGAQPLNAVFSARGRYA